MCRNRAMLRRPGVRFGREIVRRSRQHGARAIATPVSVSKPQPIATGSEAAVSAAAGRAVAHAASPAGTSAPADDNATPAQPPLASTALINLALVEGSDATGSAASALQAANAAASSSAPAADAAAAAASPFTALQVPMTITAGGPPVRHGARYCRAHFRGRRIARQRRRCARAQRRGRFRPRHGFRLFCQRRWCGRASATQREHELEFERCSARPDGERACGRGQRRLSARRRRQGFPCRR